MSTGILYSITSNISQINASSILWANLSPICISSANLSAIYANISFLNCNSLSCKSISCLNFQWQNAGILRNLDEDNKFVNFIDKISPEIQTQVIVVSSVADVAATLGFWKKKGSALSEGSNYSGQGLCKIKKYEHEFHRASAID